MRSRPVRASTILPVLILGLLVPASWASQNGIAPDFRQVLVSYAEPLSLLSSETEALAFYNSALATALGLRSFAVSPDRPGDADLLKEATHLTAALAAWQLAVMIRQTADRPSAAGLSGIESRLSHQHWLLDRQAELSPVAKLVRVLSWAPGSSIGDAEDGFGQYAAFLDGMYSSLTEGEESWVHIAEHKGLEGVQQRLAAFWDGKLSEPAEQAAWIARYFNTRLRPVLRAQLAAVALRAEAAAESRARSHWSMVRHWADIARQRKGLARLCGTWQWTVHNHQNHKDHKMAISFPPPDPFGSAESTGLRPKTIVIHGDSVYLRWEFPGGVQEDSLLFAAEGQRLEGTFTNSAGAWGSIAGKRVRACEVPGR
jgi:hypothetical protein